MAFPWLFEEGFEGGDRGNFSSESDNGDRLDFPGPFQLMELAYPMSPHRGAYCMRVDLERASDDAYVAEDTSFDTSADGTIYSRFYLYLSPDFAIGNDGDELDIFALMASATEELMVTIARADPDGVVIGLRETSAGTEFPYVQLTLDAWHCIELMAHVDAGGGNDGHATLWVSGAKLRITGLDQGAITDARLGVMNQTGNFKGHVYFDSVFADDGRLFPMGGPMDMSVALGDETMVLTQSGWAFVSGGEVAQLQLIDGGSGDCKAKLYDTDELMRSLHQLRDQLNTTVANQVAYSEHAGVLFQRGCYVELSGTSPMALVRVAGARDVPAAVVVEPEGAEASEVSAV